MTTKKTPSTRQHKSPSPDITHERIAIIGGGIAGLLCAYILTGDGHTVELFESSAVLGGRIRSFRFNDTLLNEIERQNDDEREPVKGKAILENALLPASLMSDSAKQAAKEGDPKYTPTPKRPLVLKRSDKEGSVPEKERGYRLYATEDYDKRLWDRLEFNAEFGPMRIELEVQRMLDFLLEHLNIPALNEGPPDTVGKAHDLGRMQRFPPFSSPASAGDPVYDLKPEEDGKNPLELLKLGVCRAVVDLHFDFVEPPLIDAGPLERKKVSDFETAREDLTNNLHNAAATQRPTEPVFETWLRRHIREPAYWAIQRYGQIPVLYGAETYIKLHTMGFWNLMAAYLSHNALSKVRELGTFYHLIPENPNAAEWLTWWMRQISISGHLQGVFGGMQSVTEKLASKMGFPGNTPGNLTINPGTTVTRLTKKDGQIGVALTDGNMHSQAFSRVVLALPTVPAEKLIQNSTLWGPEKTAQNDKKKFAAYLHSALPFQLLKVFFVVRERWWEEDVRANPGATRYPTREVYFWKSRMKDSRRGLVMLYMDRPSAAFWANYVPRPTQDDIDELCRPKLDPKKATKEEIDGAELEAEEIATLRARLKSRFVEYVNENEGQKITPDDIIWCGIMDWGREPYGAASHAWRPNREYWNTLAQLADWTVDVDGEPHLHVCGEAYSDYHAFIEGALRSSVHVLAQIRGTKRSGVREEEEEAKKQRLLDIIGHLKPGLHVKSINDAITEDQEMAEAKPAKLDRRKLASANKDAVKAEFADDEKYVKDFLDWSNKLDEIARDTTK